MDKLGYRYNCERNVKIAFLMVTMSNNSGTSNFNRYGADVNAKTIYVTQGTSYNDTPLHLAARHSHTMCIKRLIQANANLWTKNCLGLTAERFVTDSRVQNWMENIRCRPRSLQLQCSAAIRNYVKHDKTKNAVKLPLPPHLLRQVLFEQDIKIV